MDRPATGYCARCWLYAVQLSIVALILWRIFVYPAFLVPPVGFQSFAESTTNLTDVQRNRSSSSHLRRHLATVVTAYYNIPSKFSGATYLQWMKNFLQIIPCYLYVFTDAKSFRKIATMRRRFEARTRIIVLPFEHLEIYRQWDKLLQQAKMDPERYHSPELYAVWHEKAYFVLRAIKDNPFKSEFFIWCDIGSFRDPAHAPYLKQFPSPRKVSTMNDTSLYFLSTFDAVNGSLVSYISPLSSPKWRIHVGGGIIGGSIQAWKNWSEKYYQYLDYRLNHSLWAGKDQLVMLDVILQNPGIATFIHPQYYKLGPYGKDTPGNEWFYLQYYWS